MIRSFVCVVLAAAWPPAVRVPAAAAPPTPARPVAARLPKWWRRSAASPSRRASSRKPRARASSSCARSSTRPSGRSSTTRSPAGCSSARRRRVKLTVPALVKQEVEAKVAPVTEAEQKAFYDQNKARYSPTSRKPEALKQIETGLGQQRMQQRRAEFADGLRTKANVKMLLDPPRTAVSADDDPAAGPADAPVTIIDVLGLPVPLLLAREPPPSSAQGPLRRLIRVVFRDFPLLQIHPQAAKAAEAGACANDQGKFWPMHDLMFANQDKLDVADLKQHAADARASTPPPSTSASTRASTPTSGRRTPPTPRRLRRAPRRPRSSSTAARCRARSPTSSFARVIDEELARDRPIPAEKPAASQPSPAAPVTSS